MTTVGRLCRCLCRSTSLKHRPCIQMTPKRTQSSSSDSNQTNPKITVTPDGATILCWHPEPTFPYEHTKPIPRTAPEVQEGDSALKVQYLLEEKRKYHPDGPSNFELEKMFFTNRHAFRPRPKRRFAKENPPKDREGI